MLIFLRTYECYNDGFILDWKDVGTLRFNFEVQNWLSIRAKGMCVCVFFFFCIAGIDAIYAI